jgi:uncharacterized membrane protein
VTGNKSPSRIWLLVALVGLSGLAVTTYLTSNAITHSEIACSLDGCNTVLASRWSRIFGIPVSAFGMATYAVIMLGSLQAAQSPVDDLRGRLLSAGATLLGVLASIYLTIIEIIVIRAICFYCVGSAALVLIAAVLVMITARREQNLWIRIRLGSNTD